MFGNPTSFHYRPRTASSLITFGINATEAFKFPGSLGFPPDDETVIKKHNKKLTSDILDNNKITNEQLDVDNKEREYSLLLKKRDVNVKREKLLKLDRARKSGEIAMGFEQIVGPISNVATILSIIIDAIHPTLEITQSIPLIANALNLIKLLWETTSELLFSDKPLWLRLINTAIAITILSLTITALVLTITHIVPLAVVKIALAIQILYLVRGITGIATFLYDGIPALINNSRRLNTLIQDEKIITLKQYAIIKNNNIKIKRELALNLHGLAIGILFFVAIVSMPQAPYIGLSLLVALSIYSLFTAARLNPITEGIKDYYRSHKKLFFKSEYRQKRKTHAPLLQENITSPPVLVIEPTHINSNSIFNNKNRGHGGSISLKNEDADIEKKIKHSKNYKHAYSPLPLYKLSHVGNNPSLEKDTPLCGFV